MALLGDVLPGFVGHDVIDLRPGYSELSRKRHFGAAGGVKPSDLLYLFGGQLRAAVPLSPVVTHSALFGCIPSVVASCAEPQMTRVATRRVIAVVQHAASRRDGAVGKNPCLSMGQNLFARSRVVAATIPARGCLSPLPAPIFSAVNFRPKQFFLHRCSIDG